MRSLSRQEKFGDIGNRTVDIKSRNGRSERVATLWGIRPMAKKANETTGKKVASMASKLLRSKSSSKAVKSVAASALTQKVKKKK